MNTTGWAAAVATVLLALGAGAQVMERSGDIQSGRKLALAECRACHQVGAAPERLRIPGGPPSFYDIANMASTTPTSLYVFLHTSHPSMPNFLLDKKESDDVIAFILSLRRQTQ